jgi:hypothetical protein
MLILLPVLEGVLPINTLSAQSGEELNPLTIVRVKVHIVDIALHAGITDGEVDVVNVAPVLVLVLLFDHVFLVEFAQGVVEVREYLVKFTSDAQILAVVFYGVIRKKYLV